MSEAVEFVVRAGLIGIGAPIVLDLWAALLRQFGVASTNWGMVGRWVGHLPSGRFAHDNIADASPVRGERAIGWIVHYVVGIAYASALLAILGLAWARNPTPVPALIFGLITMIAPFFIMQPGMGAGIAASKAPKPNVTRLKVVMAHTVFGLAMYGVAAFLATMF
jgi:hypothetical protein